LNDIKEKGFEPMVLRYFFLQAHYRSKQNFTWESLEASRVAYDKLKNFISGTNTDNNFQETISNFQINSKSQIQKRNSELIDNYQKEFSTYISDDFNIPAALGLVWEIIKDNALPYVEKKKLILDFDRVFGLGLNKVKKAKQEEVPTTVKKLVTERETARKNKDWARADELRDKIYDLGFMIEDAGGQSVVKKK
jgi:cysteinyl-tRNA synthetase